MKKINKNIENENKETMHYEQVIDEMNFNKKNKIEKDNNRNKNNIDDEENEEYNSKGRKRKHGACCILF